MDTVRGRPRAVRVRDSDGMVTVTGSYTPHPETCGSRVGTKLRLESSSSGEGEEEGLALFLSEKKLMRLIMRGQGRKMGSVISSLGASM